MTAQPSPAREVSAAARPPGSASTTVVACCSAVYGNPLAELVVGESLHPGGLASTRRLLSASRLKPGARLLDAGCGLGASARLAAVEFGLHVEAVDASREVIDRAAAREPAGRVRWLQADVLNLPHEAGRFDAILAECVLSTMPRSAALAEMRRVLRPGGVLLVSDVEIGDRRIPLLADHGILGAALCVTDVWRPGELVAVLTGAGFRVEERTDETASILTLVDRAEARLGLAAIVARDMGLDLLALAGVGPTEASGGFGPGEARRLTDEVRAAVGEGDLRYFALMARADS